MYLFQLVILHAELNPSLYSFFFFFFFFFFFLVLYSSKNGESQEVKEMFCRRDTKNQKRFALETKYTQQN